MFSSGFQVEELPGGQLQIVDHPSMLFASIFFLIGMVPIVFFTYRIFKMGSLQPAVLMIMGVPFLIGARMISLSGSLTLDKAADSAIFHQPSYLWHTETSIPLHSIDFATIRTMRSSSYIAVVLKSGDTMTFATSSQESGQGRAVVAINRYLGAGDH